MAKPPYGRIASVAKHGSDADLLAARDDIRWLGRWTDDVHTELRDIWDSSTVTITPTDDDHRQVTIELRLTKTGVRTLLHLLDEDDG